MLRRIILFLVPVVVLAATHARALGLGDITLESSLNQPLSARIELLQTSGVRLDSIRVRMATLSDFERFSLDRPYFLDSVRFRVVEGDTSGQAAYIELSSNSPLREPYLSFVLDTRWPRGRVLTEYTVLLDPPSFASAGATQAPQPPVSIRFESAPSVTDAEGTAGDTESGEMVADDDAATSSGTAAADPVTADREVRDTPAPAPASTQRFADTADTVEVESDDTLWDIALEVRGDTAVSVQQTMLALQRLNPEAFINGNINLIRRGAVLRVPDGDALRTLDATEAVAEVGRQNRLFEDRRGMPLRSEPLAPPPAGAGGASSGDGELSVVTVDEDRADDRTSVAADAAAGERLQELDERIAALEDQLAVSREEVDRVERENSDLSERLGMLEEQLESASEIIRLRDLELAQLQEALQEQGPTAVRVTEESADTAPVVEMAPEASLPARVVNAVAGNPVVLGAILAVLVALLVLLLIRRNKAKQDTLLDAQHQRQEDEELDFSQVATSSVANQRALQDELDDESGWQSVKDETRPAGADQEPEHQAVPADSEYPTSVGPSELDDLMADVDALIDHRQLEEARQLLENAIVAEPDRQALRLRLLEVLAGQGDVDAFRLQEGALGVPADRVGQEQLVKLRQRVAELESARDDGDGTANTAEESWIPEQPEPRPEDELELELDMESSADVDDRKVLDGTEQETVFDDHPEPASDSSDDEAFSFDFDLDPEDHPEGDVSPGKEQDIGRSDEEVDRNNGLETGTGTGFDISWEPMDELQEAADAKDDGATASREPLNTDRDDLEEFDFELDIVEPEKMPDTEQSIPLEPDPEPGIESSSDEADDHAVGEEDDFSLDDFALDMEPKEADEQADGQSDADDEFDFLKGTDEAATKLDLARAYIDMGDQDGAREILAEVVAEGTEAQADDARQLLERLG